MYRIRLFYIVGTSGHPSLFRIYVVRMQTPHIYILDLGNLHPVYGVNVGGGEKDTIVWLLAQKLWLFHIAVWEKLAIPNLALASEGNNLHLNLRNQITSTYI